MSDSYSSDKRAITGAAAAMLASIAIGIGAWAHAKLQTHDVDIRELQVQARALKDAAADRSAAFENRMDRLEDKLDRVLDRLGVKP